MSTTPLIYILWDVNSKRWKEVTEEVKLSLAKDMLPFKAEGDVGNDAKDHSDEDGNSDCGLWKVCEVIFLEDCPLLLSPSVNAGQPSHFSSIYLNSYTLRFPSVCFSHLLPTWLPDAGVANNITKRAGTRSHKRYTPHTHTHHAECMETLKARSHKL